MLGSDLDEEDLRLIKLAKGGVTTETGTDAAARYERLCDLGYVKEATLTELGIAWRLSGEGLKIAYADDDSGD